MSNFSKYLCFTKSGIVGLSTTFMVTIAIGQPCPPSYGPWQRGAPPSISIVFPAPGDKCVHIAPGATSGTVSVSANSPTLQDGTRFQVDDSGCGNPDNNDTLSITLQETTWDGGAFGSGNGNTAQISVTDSGLYSVSFTAHGTTSDPVGYYDTSVSQSFYVHLDRPGCTPPSASGGALTSLPDKAVSQQFDTYPQYGYVHHHDVEGNLTQSQGVDTYVKNGAVVSSPCGGPLKQSYTAGTWSISLSFGLTQYIYVGVSYSGPQMSNQVFDRSEQHYTKWYGQMWDYTVVPTSATFNGEDTITWTGPNGGGVFYNQYNNQSCDLSTSPSILMSEVGTTCSMECCPSL